MIYMLLVKDFMEPKSADVFFDQLTLMDANYVMDETLGTASFDITKFEVGQTKMETFLIGKVRLTFL